ncbi:MAG TPA: glycoside hydrolase family 3 N-terminal domain-containing protein [Solirubrobacterales bacterium]
MGARTRRRRIAAGVVCGLALAAFAFGAKLGDGTGRPEPSVASRLPLGQLAGQRLVAGFQGTEVTVALRRMIRSGGLAGVILFAENLPSRSAGRRLVRRLQAIPRPPGLRDPLLVMVDQEGGLVKRVGGAPSASAEEMGARGTAFSRRQGRATAANLRGVGIDVDLAPVLDVARPGGTISITHRGFGSTPAQVAATGVAFAEGLKDGGVVATAKHFPGLGAARQNTDFAVERIGLSKATLRRVDEAPFRRFVEAGGEIVMLGTAIYPALSPKPAAFARPIATGELRARLGFRGVSVTDAMEAVAVRDFGGAAKAGTAAARAGTDLLLFADYRAAARAARALRQGLRSAALSRDAFEASVDRVLRLRHGLATPD